MIELRDKETGRFVGSITDEQLRFLRGQLEEEFAEDADCYLDRDTIELFDDQGIDPELLAILTSALGDREEMAIAWTRR